MKLDKHVIDMFTELTKPSDDVKMEKTCYGTISVVDGTRYVKLDGSDLLVPAASTVKTSHGDRVTVLMKNHSLTVTGNLTAPATDGGGSSSGEAGTAATIEIGTVTTGEAGSSASVTNVGTKSEAIFDFVIPKGDKGEKGDKGDTGTWDGTIPDHEHTISDITDFPTSLPASGGDADTLDGKHASDFAQMRGDITDCDEAIAFGTYNILPETKNAPTENYYYHLVVEPAANGAWIKQTAVLSDATSTSINSYTRLNINGTWSVWIKANDNGNADTLDGLHANEIASNPNLLINPDFAINQRGKTEYTASGYTVDQWKIVNSSKVTPHDGYITFESTVDKAAPYLCQIVENPAALNGKTVTLSFDYDLKSEGASITIQALANNSWSPPVPFNSTGRSVKSSAITLPENLTDLRLALVIHGTDSAPLAAVDIYGAKLELGEIATPIVPADPATELAKCQRYFCKSYLPETAPGTATAYSGEIILNAAGSSKFGQSYIAFPVSMRIIPTVTIFNPDNGESGGICHAGYAGTISAAALVPGTNGFNISAVRLTRGDDYYMHYTASAEL